MKSWLKFFGLSFFSDKISKQAVKRGYLYVALGAVFALVFLFCGVLAADLLPFSTHYKNSSGFTAFVRNAVTNDDLNLQVNGGKLSADRIADTFSNEADAAVYSVNGYQLAVDTRPADAFDDFIAYYLSNDGKEQEITLQEYEELSDAAKRNFDFKIRYTANELVLTDELTAVHEAYLTEKKSERFAELQKKQSELSRKEYQKQVYNLYVKEYYPDLSAYESTGSAPLLRNYYFHNYLNGGAEKYLFLFDDSCAGSFVTDAGLNVTFYGFYKNFPDGTVFSTDISADEFITKSFGATASFSVYVYLMNILRLLPFIALMPLLIAVITYCVLRIIKSPLCRGFGGSLKITGSYLFFGALVSAVITFVCGYFVPRNSLIIAALLIFFLTLLIRAAVLLIAEGVSVKKAVKAEAENNVTEI